MRQNTLKTTPETKDILASLTVNTWKHKNNQEIINNPSNRFLPYEESWRDSQTILLKNKWQISHQNTFLSDTETTTSSQQENIDLKLKKPVIALLDDLRNLESLSYADRLTNRIICLIEGIEEESLIQEPLSALSFQDLLNWFSLNADFLYPSIVITTEGNIRAQWRKSKSQHFAVEFLGQRDVRFVIFTQDEKYIEKITRISGQTSLDSLGDLVAQYKIKAWAGKEES